MKLYNLESHVWNDKTKTSSFTINRYAIPYALAKGLKKRLEDNAPYNHFYKIVRNDNKPCGLPTFQSTTNRPRLS